MLPSEISWNGHRIEFGYAADRQDLGTVRLVRMAVISCAGDTVRTVSFDNGHYAGDAYTDGSGMEYNGRRMTMNSVSVSGVGRYSFGYNMSVRPPRYRMGDSPELHDCGTDLWGYYNGPATTFRVPYSLVKEAYDSFSPDSRPHRPFGYAEPKDSRRPRLEYASMLVLNEITYPTGGTARLAYELNTPLNRFGGLRIRSVTCGDMARTFTYTDNDDYDTAENMMWSDRKVFLWGNFLGHAMRSQIECGDTPYVPASDTGGHGVFYPEVSETFANGDRTVYRFATGRFHDRGGGALPPSSGQQPSPLMTGAALNDEGNVSPMLTDKTVYGGDGAKVAEESYEYEPVLVRRFATGTRLYCPIVNLGDVAEYCKRGGINVTPVSLGVLCARTYGWSRIFNLRSRTVTDCVSGVSTRTNYTYDGAMRTTLPKSVSVENSDGTVVTTVSEYAFESADSMNAVLYNDYLMSDLVVGRARYCGGRLTESARTDYGVWNGSVFPKRTYRSVNGGEWHEECSFEEYGSGGNLRKYVRNACDTVSISWDARGEYPVALEKSGVEVARYTWKPLVGVTSMTGANGYTRRFGYDSAGRPGREYDSDGTILLYDYSVRHGLDGENAKNEVRTTAPLDAGGANATYSSDLYDGFGRISDRVSGGLNDDGLPVHTLNAYDVKGRVRCGFLPVAMNADEEPDEGKVMEAAMSAYGDGMAFSTAGYDALDRPVWRSTAGEAWRGKGKTTEYVGNADMEVRLFRAPLDRVSLVDGGHYAAGTLYGEKTADEDGHTLTVFTDRLGRKVLERRNDGSGDNDTYFVYNDLGQLRYVLSPEYQRSGYKDKYAYEYRYDGRGNVVKKIQPGCGYTQYWYDRADRLTFMQDATLRDSGKYRFYLYDRLGRLAVQGTCAACDRGG